MHIVEMDWMGGQMDELPAWPIIQDCGCRDQFFLNAYSLAIKVEILEGALDVDGPGIAVQIEAHPDRTS